MSALNDIKQSLADLNTSISNEIAAVSAKIDSLSNAGGASAADLADLKAQIDASRARLDAETAALTAPAAPPVDGATEQ